MVVEEAALCEQAKESAITAVRAATDSANLALQAVETSVQHYVETRDYMRLKDMAEASAVAGQVLFLTFFWRLMVRTYIGLGSAHKVPYTPSPVDTKAETCM